MVRVDHSRGCEEEVVLVCEAADGQELHLGRGVVELGAGERVGLKREDVAPASVVHLSDNRGRGRTRRVGEALGATPGIEESELREGRHDGADTGEGGLVLGAPGKGGLLEEGAEQAALVSKRADVLGNPVEFPKPRLKVLGGGGRRGSQKVGHEVLGDAETALENVAAKVDDEGAHELALGQGELEAAGLDDAEKAREVREVATGVGEGRRVEDVILEVGHVEASLGDVMGEVRLEQRRHDLEAEDSGLALEGALAGVEGEEGTAARGERKHQVGRGHVNGREQGAAMEGRSNVMEVRDRKGDVDQLIVQVPEVDTDSQGCCRRRRPKAILLRREDEARQMWRERSLDPIIAQGGVDELVLCRALSRTQRARLGTGKEDAARLGVVEKVNLEVGDEADVGILFGEDVAEGEEGLAQVARNRGWELGGHLAQGGLQGSQEVGGGRWRWSCRGGRVRELGVW